MSVQRSGEPGEREQESDQSDLEVRDRDHGIVENGTGNRRGDAEERRANQWHRTARRLGLVEKTVAARGAD